MSRLTEDELLSRADSTASAVVEAVARATQPPVLWPTSGEYKAYVTVMLRALQVQLRTDIHVLALTYAEAYEAPERG